MEFLWTFLEGLASFVSPCTLPLMPVFAAYFAGSGDSSSQRGGLGSSSMLKALAFVAGFTVVFMTLGLFAAAIGGFFASHRTAVSVVSGLIVIVFGLAFLDIIRIPGLNGLDGSRFLSTTTTSNYDYLYAFVFGLLYSLNLTPCVGAFLAAALATAAESGHALKGAALLGVYSAGLGIPFVVAGIALAKMNGLFKRIKSSYNVLVPVCGVALILFGVWMVAKPWIGKRVVVESGSGTSEMNLVNKEGKVMEITSKEMFDTEVLKSEKPVIVDFWAPWCGPCRMMGPILEEIATERADLKVCKVNVDELGDIAQQYMITSIPCIFCVKNGEVAARSVGYVDKATLLNTLGL